MKIGKLSEGVWWVVLLGVVGMLFLGFTQWRSTVNRDGQEEAEPFRIAGNLYYVGASDATAFLLTGPEGHVLIDTGHSGSAAMISASVAKLGFNVHDIKAIVNSEPHAERASGLAEMQQLSGAAIWASPMNADVIASGGTDDPSIVLLPMKAFIKAGIDTYTPARVDHRINDGDTVRVGPLALTAHITGGHTPECTTWTFSVRDGDRELQVVSVCGLDLPPGASLVDPQSPPDIRTDYEHTFQLLRALPVDIFLAAHGKDFGRYRKFSAQATAKSPADPFIDRAGYLAYIDSAEKQFRDKLARQEKDQ